MSKEENKYRIGGSLGTTIYQGPRYEGQQPIAMVFNLPVETARETAQRIVTLLNREPSDEFLVRLLEAAAKERERCAEIAESMRLVTCIIGPLYGAGWNEAVMAITNAIRTNIKREL